jgi:hypothetical protein
LPKKLLLAVATLLLAASSFAQTLQTLSNQPPDGAGIGFLLTDGTVIFQGNQESDWVKLTPDKFGSYVHGTWKQIASLPAGYVPDAFASAVLADGRVIIEGGEYNNNQFSFTNMGAIYDPVKDTWTKQKPPDGWGFIGDSPSAVLFWEANSISASPNSIPKLSPGPTSATPASTTATPKRAGRSCLTAPC